MWRYTLNSLYRITWFLVKIEFKGFLNPILRKHVIQHNPIGVFELIGTCEAIVAVFLLRAVDKSNTVSVVLASILALFNRVILINSILEFGIGFTILFRAINLFNLFPHVPCVKVSSLS